MKSKPRNHVVLALLKRSGGSGAHIKPRKAERQQQRRELHNLLKQAKGSDSFSLFDLIAIHPFLNTFIRLANRHSSNIII